MNEAKSVLNHQKSLGRKGAHIQYSFKDGGVTDSRDSVTLNIPLLIRTLELAREDIKSDAELHRVVENLIELKNKKVLTMDDYDYIAYIKKRTEQMKQGGTTQAQKEKIAKVMHEFKSGELHSGSKRGPIVTNRDQAIAIALSEANASKYAPGGGIGDIIPFANVVKIKSQRRSRKIHGDLSVSKLPKIVYYLIGKTKYDDWNEDELYSAIFVEEVKGQGVRIKKVCTRWWA